MPRSTHAAAIIGQDYESIVSSRILIVGAGGIGSELVKNMVMTGFCDVTLVDLDTIDLSNLNRQFLFRKGDVKQSKSLVAARAVTKFNPDSSVNPIHGNVKEARFDVTWFGGFRLVLNALDNLDARRHVNRMCVAAGVPLIESGTAGYLGQVQPIMKGLTECFDCMPKPTPKSYPVCTIRSTPSTPIHCIVWAKSYLFPELFGEHDDTSELDAAAAAGENASEIDELRKDGRAFQVLRDEMLASPQLDLVASNIFDKIFKTDIERLLSMADMWKFRQPPDALDRATILSSTGEPHSQPSSLLKDQRELTVAENLHLFEDSLKRLAHRARQDHPLVFDKDDEDALDFVTAASNLRSYAYHIQTLSRWKVKEMAGNIIPAIATTNAIIAGIIVLQAVQLLQALQVAEKDDLLKLPTKTRSVYLQTGKPSVPLSAASIATPNSRCPVCKETYVIVQCDTSCVSLGELSEAVLDVEVAQTGCHRTVSIFEGTRILSDPDWSDNLSRNLHDLGCRQGTFISLVDEDEVYENITIAVTDLPSGHVATSRPLLIPNFHPPHRRPPPLAALSPPTSPVKPVKSIAQIRNGKRELSDDEEVEYSSRQKKRARTEDSGNDEIMLLDSVQSSNSTRQATLLETEGLVILD
ncbi:hypothetical protein DL93DRAFT_2148917 [Clavulina sp. PMI_390]|nr:hypothetical protein DL93DRAFT_2148917 [Clavulina sp. PMI_390]